jgi:GNAT superfamily N-acetyltransferase
MDYELELSKSNRLKLAGAFRHAKKVDFSIPCVIEGQQGKVFANRPTAPSAYALVVGPFWYFAGDAHDLSAQALMKEFPPYALLMPSTPGWLETAKVIFGERLLPFTRYSFSSESLSAEHVDALLQNSKYKNAILRIDAELASRLSGQPDSFLDLADFDSADDFADRGLGFALMDGEKMMGLAYSSLVCSEGIEVSLFVDEPYRRQGVATAVSARLLQECLARGLRPNWDAANLESCHLATKLGFAFVNEYTSWYYRPEKS